MVVSCDEFGACGQLYRRMDTEKRTTRISDNLGKFGSHSHICPPYPDGYGVDTMDTVGHIIPLGTDDSNVDFRMEVMEAALLDLTTRIQQLEETTGKDLQSLTHQQAATYLGISYSTLLYWRNLSIIRGRKWKGRWWYKKEDLHRATGF